ncbi:unnamed protein product [Brassica napus]|uniref:(rape) hypothetical protein n=1 Tax=Brassica napus TaxID=3708 RepID=A0A816Y9G7_BRANA|nr:unnamed protein product [Brassica napus]
MVLWLAQTKSRFVVSSNEESSSTQASTIVDLIFNAFPFTAFITILSYKKVGKLQNCASSHGMNLGSCGFYKTMVGVYAEYSYPSIFLMMRKVRVTKHGKDGGQQQGDQQVLGGARNRWLE